MSRFKIYQIIGAVLFTALVVTAIRIIGDNLVAPEEVSPPAQAAQEPAAQPETTPAPATAEAEPAAEPAPAAEEPAAQMAKAVTDEGAEKAQEVTAVVAGDPAAGKTVFKKHLCFACHKLEPGKHGAGPSLAGFWGRAAASAEGFSYSDALKEAGIVWDAQSLDAWILNPKKMVGGTRMILAKPVKDAGDRANLIAYLKEVASP